MIYDRHTAFVGKKHEQTTCILLALQMNIDRRQQKLEHLKDACLFHVIVKEQEGRQIKRIGRD